MSDRLTSVYLPDFWGGGLTIHGLKSPTFMIQALRAKARVDLGIAQAILDATDDDFKVETYIGVYVRRKLTVLQKGKP